MIDREDFPILTPEQHLARAKRLMQLPSLAALEEEWRKGKERIEYLFEKYIRSRAAINLRAMSLDELMERFEEICLVEYEAGFDLSDEGTLKINECRSSLWAVNAELKARGRDARLKLTQFFNHYSHEVRLMAAELSYEVAPAPARRCLEELTKMQLPDISLEAGMFLSETDGEFDDLD
jgi:hypothetical protein